MMSASDQFVLSNALETFGIFWLAHFIAFRFLTKDNLFRGLKISVLVGLAFNMCHSFWANQSIFIGCVAAILYLLIGFMYVLCVFGIYETSIRMRLIRELHGAYPSGLTLTELYQRYNAEIILIKRLERFVKSGDLEFDGAFYKKGKKKNLFEGIDLILNTLARWAKVR